ncbi:hypothetical protein RhiJN_23101 [Ceratobasidium sp. AG-Ba]|nr:hypothetical protein RhiJN_23101 [Ceratobasidium sp. AG-Ba]
MFKTSLISLGSGPSLRHALPSILAASSNKAWTKPDGLEAFEVGKCELTLGLALDWRLWVGREALSECVTSAPSQPSYPSLATSTISTSPRLIAFARGRTGTWENTTLSILCGHAGPACSGSPISTIYTRSSASSLAYYTESEPESDIERSPTLWRNRHMVPSDPKFVNEPEVTLHGCSVKHPSATMGSSMHITFEPFVHTRPVLPPSRSFDRPPMCRGPSHLVTPQTNSNMGCKHMSR